MLLSPEGAQCYSHELSKVTLVPTSTTEVSTSRVTVTVSMRRAIVFHLFLEFIVRDRFLSAPLGNDGQVVEIFEQLFIVSDREDDGSFLALFIGQILDRCAHGIRPSFQTLVGDGEFATASCASVRMRSTIAKRPFLRVGLR